MSASPLISLGMRAMTANYAALQATGNNIANANTRGYSRQQVELETSMSQYSGSGFFGKGVDVSTVARQHSDFLTREVALTGAVAAADFTRSEQLKQLEKLFETGEAGIGYSAGQLFNSFVDVSNGPQDISSRQVSLSRAQELANRFHTTADRIDAMQSGVSQDLLVSVRSVNELARQIAELNQRISVAEGVGHTPNDLLDKRELALQDLSKLLQVSTIAANDGSVSVFFGGGQQLVLGSDTTTLTLAPDNFDPDKVQLQVIDDGVPRPVLTEQLGAGSIVGLLRFQNNDLTAARNLLGQLAVAVSGGLNEQQSLGWDLNKQFGADILAVGAPKVLPSQLNSGNAALSVEIDDAQLVQASDYELLYQGAGNYELSRVSGQRPPLPVTVTAAQLAAGYTMVDGLRITLNSGTPAAGDRFLLQPVAVAARDMRRVLDDPRGVAAASSVSATLGTTNTGSASVVSLRTVSNSINPKVTVSLTFTNDSGAFSATFTDNTTPPPVVTTGTGTWTAGQPIAYNGWEMNLNGVPRTGDVLTVGETQFPSNSNGNANALMGLRDSNLVGAVRANNGLTAPASGDVIAAGNNVTDAYASTLAEIGIRVQSSGLASDQSSAIEKDAVARQSNLAGVNLDEEASRLIQYQQSYQAAAKMLQVAQSLFDTLLQATAR
jgi:flagellar hook-associated protein 1